MMKLKKGSRVVVMNEKVPTSRRVAKIIYGNEHPYSVRFESFSKVESDTVVERVARRFIRTCPPSMKAAENREAGDVVEGSKRSRDLKFTNDNRSLSFKIPQFIAMTDNRRGDCLPIQNDAGVTEPHSVSSRTLKRVSPYCSSLLNPYAGKAKKVGANEKEGSSQRVPAQLLAKVDNVTYHKNTMGEKCMQPSSSNCSNGYFKLKTRKSNGAAGCPLERLSDPNESDIDECSVGSCSVGNGTQNIISRHPVTVTHQETNTLCSDAESFNCSSEKERIFSPPFKEDLARIIHRYELHAYRSTLEVFYASGPLSWEKEELLTNLRINLCISNDEHLVEDIIDENLVFSRTTIGGMNLASKRSKDDSVHSSWQKTVRQSVLPLLQIRKLVFMN